MSINFRIIFGNNGVYLEINSSNYPEAKKGPFEAAIPARKQELAGCGTPLSLVCSLSVALATHSLQTKPAVTPRSANSYFLAGIAAVEAL